MRISKSNRIVTAISFSMMLSGLAQADILTFDFTGRVIVADYDSNVLINNELSYTPISATLTYDTVGGIGSSGLSLAMDDFWGLPATFHDISMSLQSGTNLITGSVLVDWNANYDMPMHVEWDATGLLNAIDYGLQVGDKLSGSSLYRDANGDGVWNSGEFVADIGSATPYSDFLQESVDLWYQSFQGPAPLAATSGSTGLSEAPFTGVRGYFDIGSGNSMYVTSISSVPVPAAVWLLGSGLLGLMGVCRRKNA